MADENMKREFIDGINEVFATMFTDGVNDGVYFYPLDMPETFSIYGEAKFKQYHVPVLLVAKVKLDTVHGDTEVETSKGRALFSIPVKSLTENGIDVSYKNLLNLKRGVMRYKDTFYEIDTIEPTTFVADTFMVYQFSCTENLSLNEDNIELVEPPVEEGEENV